MKHTKVFKLKHLWCLLNFETCFLFRLLQCFVYLQMILTTLFDIILVLEQGKDNIPVFQDHYVSKSLKEKHIFKMET